MTIESYNGTNMAWTILSPIELSIKNKIETIGVPLKDWNIKINRGILTGYNDAFIISGEKRQEILSNCQSEEERQRTDNIIRPILRGRDIKRYKYDFADLYLIATFPSKHYDIDDYPSVREHLTSFGIERLEQSGKEYIINGEKFKSRKKTCNKWFETQDSISYWDDFNDQKIVWGNLNLKASFCIANGGMFINAPCAMIVPANYYLLAILNSKVSDYYIRNLGVTRNGGYFEYKPMFIEQIPIPIDVKQDEIAELCSLIIKRNDTIIEKQLDNAIYKLYNLNDDEIKFLENY